MTPDELWERLGWLFAFDEEDDDGPELHLVGLTGDETVACFEALRSVATGWADSVAWLYGEERDAPVDEVPDLARRVVEETASAGSIWPERVVVDGVTLPSFSLFLVPGELQFFWFAEPGEWTPDLLAAFLGLLGRLRAHGEHAALSPDPRYDPEVRAEIGAALAEWYGDPTIVRL